MSLNPTEGLLKFTFWAQHLIEMITTKMLNLSHKNSKTLNNPKFVKFCLSFTLEIQYIKYF